eukprot:TRINITY_DN8743_c0_g2_i1.p1 TRINITY_DN8743_c0_g2~~TRINITY_DN8743_c0_g2_i1.p1  ORF type:complete len:145 (+),score=29.45 TRINITY_DN8743_c0_g2_i1:303-737(+)
MRKLQAAKELPKEEVQHLYREAANYLPLPPLVVGSSESDRRCLLRARAMLKAHLELPRSARKYSGENSGRKIGSARKLAECTKQLRVQTPLTEFPPTIFSGSLQPRVQQNSEQASHSEVLKLKRPLRLLIHPSNAGRSSTMTTK